MIPDIATLERRIEKLSKQRDNAVINATKLRGLIDELMIEKTQRQAFKEVREGMQAIDWDRVPDHIAKLLWGCICISLSRCNIRLFLWVSY